MIYSGIVYGSLVDVTSRCIRCHIIIGSISASSLNASARQFFCSDTGYYDNGYIL